VLALLVPRTRILENAGIHGHVTHVYMLQVGAQQLVGLTQGVKRQGRAKMMLGVVGHVPHQQPDGPPGQGGAGIAKRIGI
jgi:hypothetical protein